MPEAEKLLPGIARDDAGRIVITDPAAYLASQNMPDTPAMRADLEWLAAVPGLLPWKEEDHA